MSTTAGQDGADRQGRPSRRPVLRVGLAGGSQAQRAAIKDVVVRVREVESEIVDLGDEQPNSAVDSKIGLLGLVLDPTDHAPWKLALQSGNGTSPFTIALCADRSAELIELALRAGADDVLSIPPTYEDALRVLLRASEARRRADSPDQKKICSLVSVSGGRGTSSLTVCLGFATQQLLAKQAVLVDLDLQPAPLSVLLDVEPEHTIADLADPTSPIDSIRLESVLTKREAGPSLLAAPKLIEQTELVSATTVEAAIRVLHDLFDVVLVDCGSHLNESSVVVFEHSDHLLYVLDQSISAVRAAQRFLKLYESLELKKGPPLLIVNQYRPRDVVTLDRLETALHLPIFATVPEDRAAFHQMQTTGTNLWNISSGASARRGIESLTRKLFSSVTEDTSKPSVFSRLFSTSR